MHYTVEDLQEIMDEEVVIVGDFASKEITGTLEEIMGDTGVIFIGGKSVSLSEITEIYLFDDQGETYLYDPRIYKLEEDEAGVFSDEQFLSLQGEFVKVVKLTDSGEEILQGVVKSVDINNQVFVLENWENKPIRFNEVITVTIKDVDGNELELAPENYMSAFEDDEQYVVNQFYSLLKNHVRIIVASEEEELELKGVLDRVFPENGGSIVLKEFPELTIPVQSILDFFVITNNGDEQFLVPMGQGGELGYAIEVGEAAGYYSPDILAFLVNRVVKIKGDFEGLSEIKGVLLEVNEVLFKVKGFHKEHVIEEITSVFVKDVQKKWNYVPPVSFEHRNVVNGAYDPILLDNLIGQKIVFTISLPHGGYCELSGSVRSIDIEQFTLKLEEGESVFDFPLITDIYIQNENGVLSFVKPDSGLPEDRKLAKISENELLSLLLRSVIVEGNFGAEQHLGGMVSKCDFRKGYLILSNFPDKPIALTEIKSYKMINN